MRNNCRLFAAAIPLVVSLMLLQVATPAWSVQGSSGTKAETYGIHWEPLEKDIFIRAKRENKFVILDLHAVWCHWCHVMDEKTYSDPEVDAYIAKHFIAVKADQDARPDLSAKYGDYGWPATVFFDSSGKQVRIESGFIRAKDLLEILQSVVNGTSKADDSKPEEAKSTSVAGNSVQLAPSLRDELLKRHNEGYDTKNGAWSFEQKFIDPESLELEMELARAGDQSCTARCKKTLAAAIKLLDPVWGGVYQYSTDKDWNHPHFEKIMSVQADNIRLYSQAYSLWKNPEYLDTAKAIANYLKDFLTAPQGAFFVSQDADLVQGKHSSAYYSLNDQKRRKLGIPRVDRKVYARENGEAVSALCDLYAASGDKTYLEQATQAVKYVIQYLSLTGGGYNHSRFSSLAPFLDDSLWMGKAFLSLYEVTGDKQWLLKAEAAATFIYRTFQSQTPNKELLSFEPTADAVISADANLDQHIQTARFANLLFNYSGRPEDRELAENAMRYVAQPANANKKRIFVAGILLADRELSSNPVHVTVVGAKDDPSAKALFQTALTIPTSYKRIDWYDKKEGPLLFMDVEYPDLPKAAAFLCTAGRCSSPAYSADALLEKVKASK